MEPAPTWSAGSAVLSCSRQTIICSGPHLAIVWQQSRRVGPTADGNPQMNRHSAFADAVSALDEGGGRTSARWSTSRRSRARRRACRRSAWRCGAASTWPRGRPREHPRPIPRCPRTRACPSSGASARRATCPPCRRTSPRCSGSGGAFGRSRTSSARRHPSTVCHSPCSGARSSPPSFPGGLAKVTARGKHTAGAEPPAPGARPSCLNCSIFRAHGAHFPVITRTTS